MYLLSCTAPIRTVALLCFWPISWCRKLTLIQSKAPTGRDSVWFCATQKSPWQTFQTDNLWVSGLSPCMSSFNATDLKGKCFWSQIASASLELGKARIEIKDFLIGEKKERLCTSEVPDGRKQHKTLQLYLNLDVRAPYSFPKVIN